MFLAAGCNQEFAPEGHQNTKYIPRESAESPERNSDPTNSAMTGKIEMKAVAYTDCANFNHLGFTPSFTYMPIPQ
jgi:hypothetical protein